MIKKLKIHFLDLDLNQGPFDCQADTLPTELSRLYFVSPPRMTVTVVLGMRQSIDGVEALRHLIPSNLD